MDLSSLRRRLLLAVAASGTGACRSPDCDPNPPPEHLQWQERECVEVWTPDGRCSPPEDAWDTVQARLDTGDLPPVDCGMESVDRLSISSPEGWCCYDVTMGCVVDFGPSCCGYGRPYVAEGQARTADPTDRDDWARPLTPATDGLTDAQRRRLADFWLHNALSEHSSVAGFNRFALDLLAHGAPADLVLRAQRAAIEEIRHAQLCFGLASAYAGRPVGPGPIAMDGSAPVARDLVELAVATARDGCLGETVAAWLAIAMLDRAADPAVRRVLGAITRDETRHAELAWATLRWAIDTGGAPVRAAAVAALSVGPPTQAFEAPRSDALAAHGLLSTDETVALAARGVTALVRPCLVTLTGGTIPGGRLRA